MPSTFAASASFFFCAAVTRILIISSLDFAMTRCGHSVAGGVNVDLAVEVQVRGGLAERLGKREQGRRIGEVEDYPHGFLGLSSISASHTDPTRISTRGSPGFSRRGSGENFPWFWEAIDCTLVLARDRLRSDLSRE